MSLGAVTVDVLPHGSFPLPIGDAASSYVTDILRLCEPRANGTSQTFLVLLGGPLRLLHLISSVNPAAGGPIEGIRQLSSIYLSAGVEVEIASLDEPFSRFVQDFPLKVHALGPAYLGAYCYAPGLVGWLRENCTRYDCVIVNGLWQYHGFAAWLALRKTKTPYVVFTHGMLDPWFKRQYPLKHLKKWLYWPWGEYRSLRDAAAVLFTCEEEKLLAAQSFWLYRTNAIVVGYGTRRPTVDLEAVKERYLSEFPHLRNKRLLTFLGRIHPKKGCDLLIRAFAQTLSRDPDWHLVIVGPDQLGWQSEMVKLSQTLGIQDRITWPGLLLDDRKWGALAAAEAFVLPSHQENFGIAVVEALACSKPVLITDKINIWREIEEESAGLVRADTLAGTIELLETWMQIGDSERSAIARRALPCFNKHFDLETRSAAMLDLLAELARARRTQPSSTR